MRSIVVGAMAVAMAGCASGAVERMPPPALSAEATLKDKDGKQVGAATLIQEAAGVRVVVTGYRLPPGDKGVHIHAIGACQPPDFASAGAHFNPAARKHGLASPDGPHAGDLPNMKVSAAGEGGIDHVNPHITLEPGKPNSLFGPGGSSLVVHAQADDGRTDPTGNSGGRLACGVIVK